MFKSDNTHHYANPFYMMKMLDRPVITGTTLPVGTYGLTLANASNNYMTVENGAIIFREDLPVTFEFQGELNNTNRNITVNSVAFGIGKQGAASNVFNCQFRGGKLILEIYNVSGQSIKWESDATVISSASNGLHTFAISYNRTATNYGTVIMVMDGVVVPNTVSGTGTGVISPNPGTRFWFGGNPYQATTYTAQHYAGDIAKLHYSSYARSAADLIKRQNDMSRLFPIDKYSNMAWDYRNGLTGWCKPVQTLTKYV